MRQTLHSGRQVLRRRAFRRFWLGMLIAAVPVLLWQHRLAVADLYGIAAGLAVGFLPLLAPALRERGQARAGPGLSRT